MYVVLWEQPELGKQGTCTSSGWIGKNWTRHDENEERGRQRIGCWRKGLYDGGATCLLSNHSCAAAPLREEDSNGKFKLTAVCSSDKQSSQAGKQAATHKARFMVGKSGGTGSHGAAILLARGRLIRAKILLSEKTTILRSDCVSKKKRKQTWSHTWREHGALCGQVKRNS